MKLKLSFSAVQKFIQCPKKYNLHYNLKIREMTKGSALFFGTAIDEALNFLLMDPERSLAASLEVFRDKWTRQEINGVQTALMTHPNVVFYNGDFDKDVLLDDDIITIFDRLRAEGFEFDHQNLEIIHKELCKAKKDKTFSEDDKLIFNYLSWFSLLRKGEMMITAYHAQVLPRIKRIIGMQKYFSIQNEVGDELIGFIDMIAEYECDDGVVRLIRFDHKTSSTKYKDESVRESEQLATYTLATEEEFKEKTAAFIVMEKNIRKRDPRVRITTIIDEIPSALEDKVLEQYDVACERIKNEEFPANLSSCEDEKGFRCAYYNLCHKNDMTGLVKLDVKAK